MHDVVTNKIVLEILPYVTSPDLVRTVIATELRKYELSERVSGSEALQNIIEEFLEAKKIEGKSWKTIENYSLLLKKFAEFLGGKNAVAITAKDVRKYIAYLADKKAWKQSSCATAIYVLKSFFGWGVQEELIIRNPMTKIQAPKIDRMGSIKNLSEEQLERLRQACKDERESCMVEMYFSTGCRLSELSGVNIEDVDLAQRQIDVVGKGRKHRKVYFSVRAKLLLKKYLQVRKGTSEALFTSKRTPFGPLKENSIEGIIKKIGERAGLHVYPHRLRHTFASFGAEVGIDLLSLQTLMGHERSDTTKIYARISGNKIKQDHAKFIR